MSEPLRALIEALRHELVQYGEMLARLEQQQDCIMRRAADDVLASVSAVQEQGAAIQLARRDRELKQSQLARHFRQEGESSLAALTTRMHPDYRPLVRALMDENNELLARVQQRARQNHVLLRRSLDLMQGLIETLFQPGHRTNCDEQGQPVSGNGTSAVLCTSAA
jgi:hypothetical protein